MTTAKLKSLPNIPIPEVKKTKENFISFSHI